MRQLTIPLVLAAPLLAVMVLTGCTAGSTSAGSVETATPSATPDKSAFVPFEPDVTVVRDFPDAAGNPVACTVRVAAVEDPATSTGDAGDRLSAAHAFLAEGDWSADAVPDDQLVPSDPSASSERGDSTQELLASALMDRIGEDFRGSGLLGDGVSYQSFVSCSDG